MGRKPKGPGGITDPLLAIDLDSEWYLGATNINGTVGNGRLTAGISLWGELTVLRWPSVTHFDQLRYLTAFGFPFRNYHVRCGEDEPSESYRRWGRPVVVSPGMGSFGGVFIEAGGSTSWFHSRSWEPSQRYEPEDSNILVTTLRNDELGVSVSITDAVDVDADVLARRFHIECTKREPVGGMSFIYYANLSPSLTRARYYPFTWRLVERRSDYLAVYDDRRDAVLHFRPGQDRFEDPSAVASSLAGNPSRAHALIDNVDGAYGREGVFIAWGSDAASSGHVVGRDSHTAGRNQWTDAFDESDRGRLGGNPAAPRPANAALSYPLELGRGTAATVIVYLAASPSGSDALELLDSARSGGFAGIEERASSHWSGLSAATRVPPTGDRDCERVARRSILALGVGTDSESGAIIASVSRQPQYCFDWPRDGAFFDYALDLAGHTGAVTRHAGFYSKAQIRSARPRWKRGHFRGNYYADGEAGPIHFVEIDETGLAAWDLWRHARYLDGTERDEYLARVYPAIEAAADALLRMRPRGGGFPRRAREDDNILRKTSTLHGAASTYLGLVSAGGAGAQINESTSKVERWTAWAGELRDKMIDCYDEDEGRFAREGWRGAVWVMWPARILPLNDERMRSQAEHLMEMVEPFTRKTSGGAAYAAERLVACALAWRDVPEKLERVRRALAVIALEAVTPGTGHLGEVTLVGDFAGTGERVFQNRTSIPHLWEGALLYLAFAAAYSPEWFDFADSPFTW